jgi:hypothetical protein
MNRPKVKRFLNIVIAVSLVILCLEFIVIFRVALLNAFIILLVKVLFPLTAVFVLGGIFAALILHYFFMRQW